MPSVTELLSRAADGDAASVPALQRRQRLDEALCELVAMPALADMPLAEPLHMAAAG
jgi:hypothetical protein